MPAHFGGTSLLLRSLAPCGGELDGVALRVPYRLRPEHRSLPRFEQRDPAAVPAARCFARAIEADRLRERVQQIELSDRAGPCDGPSGGNLERDRLRLV